MTPKEIIHSLNVISGHAKRDFSDLEFALACDRENLTLADPDTYNMDDDKAWDGNNDSHWAAFHIGAEFVRQMAQCVINKTEPDYEKIYEAIVAQCEHYKNFKENDNGQR
ncbi:hypothetical protein [Fibrobacter sp.]